MAAATCMFENLLCDTGHEIDVCVLKRRNALGGSISDSYTGVTPGH